jgi:hypothetical protein
MDTTRYLEVLNECLIPTIENQGFSHRDFAFQQDNASCHTARPVYDWFTEEDMEVLDWPACSPDLNPIEHLWGRLKYRIGALEEMPSGQFDLWRFMEREWYKIATNHQGVQPPRSAGYL